MSVLKQGLIFKHITKNRWTDAWMIIRQTDNNDGPELLLFKDSSAKKLLITDTIKLKSIAENIRFGATLRRLIGTGSTPDIAKDARLCDLTLIAISYEKIVKKSVQIDTIWLCAVSIADLFDIISLLARSLNACQYPAPAQNEDIDTDGFILSKYVPTPFQPTNDWESFWNNPPSRPQLRLLQVAANIKKTRAQSVDALDEKKTKTTKPKKSRKQQSKNKKNSKSTVSVNEIGISGRIRSRSSNSSSSELSFSVKPSPIVIVELKRERELNEKPALAPKPKRHDSITSTSTDLSAIQKTKKTNDKYVHAEVQTDSEHQSTTNSMSKVKIAGYEAVVDQLKEAPAKMLNRQQSGCSSSSDFEDALSRGQSTSNRNRDRRTSLLVDGEYSISQIEINDKMVSKHSVVYDHNGSLELSNYTVELQSH